MGNKYYRCHSDYIIELHGGMRRCFTAYKQYRSYTSNRVGGIYFIDDENDEHFVLLDELNDFFDPKFTYGK